MFIAICVYTIYTVYLEFLAIKISLSVHRFYESVICKKNLTVARRLENRLISLNLFVTFSRQPTLKQ